MTSTCPNCQSTNTVCVDKEANEFECKNCGTVYFTDSPRLATRQCPGCETYSPGTHKQDDGSFLCDYHEGQVRDFPYRAPEV